MAGPNHADAAPDREDLKMAACTGRYLDVGHDEPSACDQPAVVRIWIQGWNQYYPYCSVHRGMLTRIAELDKLSIRYRKIGNP